MCWYRPDCIGRLILLLLFACCVAACSSSDGDPGEGADGGAIDVALPADLLAPGDRFVGDVDPAALTLQVYPASMRSYAGASVLLLAELRGTAGFSLDLMLESKPEKMPLKLFPVDDGDRTLFEVLVTPRAEQLGQTISVTLSVADTRLGVVREGTMEIEVVDSAPPEPPAGLLDRFVGYLEADHAGLGIGGATEWQPLGGVVVPDDSERRHWLYVSSKWELGLSWATAAAPDDSATIYLRQRSDFTPSFAAWLASRAADDPITEQAPPADPLR